MSIVEIRAVVFCMFPNLSIVKTVKQIIVAILRFTMTIATAVFDHEISIIRFPGLTIEVRWTNIKQRKKLELGIQIVIKLQCANLQIGILREYSRIARG